MRRTVVFLILCTLLLACGCDKRKLIAGGERDVIVVLAEDDDWNKTKEVLKNALEREVYTPNPEKIYELLHGKPELITSYIYAKNLILIGKVDGLSKASELISDLLTNSALSKVRNKQAFIFEKEEPWAVAQYLMVIATPGEPELTEIIEKNKDTIFQFFERASYKRAKWLIYSAGREKENEKRLLEKMNISLELPLGFFMRKEDTITTFVTFTRKFPYRLISVGYADEIADSLFFDDACELRDSIGTRYFEGDSIDKSRTKGMHTTFLGREAYKLEGIWLNNEKIMGGPFRTYFFNDILQSRAYIIDIHVFAPGKKKWFYLMELESVAATFETFPIDKQTIQEN